MIPTSGPPINNTDSGVVGYHVLREIHHNSPLPTPRCACTDIPRAQTLGSLPLTKHSSELQCC